MIRQLASRSDVEYVEPNYIIRASAIPGDPQFPNMWDLNNTGQLGGITGSDIQATAAWDLSKGSSAVAVGVLDSGADLSHPDLVSNLWSAPAQFSLTLGGRTITCPAGTRGFNAVDFSCTPRDDHGHGTHVSGTIGATGNNGIGVTGINWTVTVVELKVLDSTGSGTSAMAINAIDAAIQLKNIFAGSSNPANIRVLSASWGGNGYSQALYDAVSRANAANILFVAAAGNDGANTDSSPNYPANFNLPNVVSVAATDSSDNRASFSNYGASTVHLGAPGVSILSTTMGGGYAYWSGTSMATPHVSGVAALALSYCNVSTTDLKTLLLRAVDPKASLSGITVTGGRLNAYKTLRSCDPGSFGLSAGVNTLSLLQGKSGSFNVSLIPQNGYAGSVNLSISGLPSGVTASVTTNPVYLSGTATVSSVVTLAVGAAAASGSYTVTITASDGRLSQTASVSLSVTAANPPTATGSASFVKLDTTTSGSWQGVYGADGYNVITNSTSYPSYATVSGSGLYTYQWTGSTTDTRALQKTPPVYDRIAACWYSSSSLNVDLTLTDQSPHQVAIYMLDWENYGRTERVDVLDGNGSVLDSRVLSGFSKGQYLVWNLSGRISIRITNTNPSANAVISGIFFGRPSSAVSSGAATFLRTDTTTGGSWRGVFGSDGYNIIGDQTKYPAGTAITASGNYSYTWSNPSTDPRSLQSASSNGSRLAACWYSSGTIQIDLAFPDQNRHDVAVYMLDWERYGRTQRVDVVDANNGILDTRAVANFSGGQYLVWSLSGRVSIRITNTNTSANAVISAIFFGSSSTPPPVTTTTGTAAYVRTDTITAGTWRGVYGSNGYNVLGDASSYPGYVSLNSSGMYSYTWASTTADSRAAQKVTASGDRIAACWYSASSIQIDLTFNDQVTHQFALYMLDWERYGRTQRVDVLDSNNILLDTRNVSAFSGGQYLVWNLSGRVSIRITKTNSTENAVVSGLFFQ